MKTRKLLIFTYTPHSSLYRAKPGSAHNKDMIAEKIDNIFETRPRELVEIVDSCNGLVCIWFPSRLSYVIFNFSTRESKKIPACDSERVSRSGFGYDDSSDDYKLVKLSSHGVYAYSLRIDFWKKVQDFGEYSFYPPSQGTVLNGVIHWVCLDKSTHSPSRIAAFDLMSEKLSEIALPSAFFTNTNNVDYSVSRIEVFEGRLHLKLNPSHSDESWVMKKYGVVQSWTKYHIKNPFPLDLLKDDDAIVVFWNSDKFNLPNRKERANANLVLHGIPNKAKFKAKPYVESLVSPIVTQQQ